MRLDIEKLKDYWLSGRLRKSDHPTLPLHVWSYSQQTVFDRAWDDVTLMCRGLVTDDQGVVISRPFPKFFNWGEPLAPSDTGTPFYAYEKMDGTLIIASKYEDEVIVSTKGSFTTWHSEKAREMLQGFEPLKGCTFIFELIHPQNRIVVDYGDYEGLVLLGAVENESGLDHFKPDIVAEQCGWWGDVVRPHKLNLIQTLQTVKNPEAGPNHEGFVLVYPNPQGSSTRVKLKFAQYIQLHSILTRLSNVAVWEALRNNQLEELLDVIPDELYEKISTYADELIKEWAKIMFAHTVYAATAEVAWADRKSQAKYILAHAEHPGLAFSLLDRKLEQARLKVYDLIRPSVTESWTYLK